MAAAASASAAAAVADACAAARAAARAMEYWTRERVKGIRDDELKAYLKRIVRMDLADLHDMILKDSTSLNGEYTIQELRQRQEISAVIKKKESLKGLWPAKPIDAAD